MFGHEAEEEVARRFVALADGETVGVVPVGIDARAAEVDACAGPQDQESEPATEVGEVADRPLHAVGHWLVVVRIREHPLRGSLENVQLLDLIGDRRRDLEAGGARPDEREPCAGDIDRVVPPDRMERRAVEVVDAGDVGKLRSVECADRGDDSAGREFVDRAIGRSNTNRPGARRLVVGRSLDLGLEPTVFVDAVLVHHADEVVAQLGVLGEVLGPMVGRFE